MGQSSSFDRPAQPSANDGASAPNDLYVRIIGNLTNNEHTGNGVTGDVKLSLRDVGLVDLQHPPRPNYDIGNYWKPLAYYLGTQFNSVVAAKGNENVVPAHGLTAEDLKNYFYTQNNRDSTFGRWLRTDGRAFLISASEFPDGRALLKDLGLTELTPDRGKESLTAANIMNSFMNDQYPALLRLVGNAPDKMAAIEALSRDPAAIVEKLSTDTGRQALQAWLTRNETGAKVAQTKQGQIIAKFAGIHGTPTDEQKAEFKNAFLNYHTEN
jgi:hypothetical protein